MARIRSVASDMLAQKMADANAISVSDSEAKRDIMSLLVRARKTDMDRKMGGYAMSDEAMMDQVVSSVVIYECYLRILD